MKIVRTILFILFIMFTFVCVAKALDQPEYAGQFQREHWEEWEIDQKVFFVLGFGAGIDAALTKIVHDFPPLQDYAIAMSEMLADIDTITIVRFIDWMYGLEEYRHVPVNAMVANIKRLVWKERDRIEEEFYGNGQ